MFSRYGQNDGLMDNEATEADCLCIRSTQISGPLTLGAGGFWVSLPLCRAVVFVFVSQSIFRRNQKKKDIFGIGTASSRPKMCVEWSGRRRTRRIRAEKKESIKPF